MKKKLLAKRHALVLELAALGKIEEDGGTLTAEQLARFTAIQVEIEGPDGKGAQSSDQNCLDAQIARAGIVEARVAQLDAPVGSAQASGTDPAMPNNPAAGARAKEGFENVGEFFAVVASRRDDPRLASLYAEQSMQDGTTGGFMVPTKFNTGDPLQIAPQGSVFRNRGATVVPGDPSTPDAEQSWPVLNQDTTNAAAPAHVYGGVVVSESAEGVAAALTGLKLKNVKTKPQEVTGAIIVNNKLLRNWGAASTFIPRQLNAALSGHENRRFFFGDGVGKPLGATVAPACIAIPRTTANRFKYADAVAMRAKGLRGRGGSYFWAISQSVEPELLTMEDPEGHLVYQANAREGLSPTLFGDPIEWLDCNPLLGTKSDVSYLNPSFYFIHDGVGPVVALDTSLKFLEGQTVFKILRSLDGQPWLNGPATLEGGYEVSPFITLDTPAS